jgi:hypothetical protein
MKDRIKWKKIVLDFKYIKEVQKQEEEIIKAFDILRSMKPINIM